MVAGRVAIHIFNRYQHREAGTCARHDEKRSGRWYKVPVRAHDHRHNASVSTVPSQSPKGASVREKLSMKQAKPVDLPQRRRSILQPTGELQPDHYSSELMRLPVASPASSQASQHPEISTLKAV
jgi:hypothetical protein